MATSLLDVDEVDSMSDQARVRAQVAMVLERRRAPYAD